MLHLFLASSPSSDFVNASGKGSAHAHTPCTLTLCQEERQSQSSEAHSEAWSQVGKALWGGFCEVTPSLGSRPQVQGSPGALVQVRLWKNTGRASLSVPYLHKQGHQPGCPGSRVCPAASACSSCQEGAGVSIGLSFLFCPCSPSLRENQLELRWGPDCCQKVSIRAPPSCAEQQWGHQALDSGKPWRQVLCGRSVEEGH